MEKMTGSRNKTRNNGGRNRVVADRPLTSSQVIISSSSNDEVSTMEDTESRENSFNAYAMNEEKQRNILSQSLKGQLKQQLFARNKFVPDLEFDMEDGTLCRWVMDAMGECDKDEWRAKWKMARPIIRETINTMRTNKTTAIKRGFKGKL